MKKNIVILLGGVSAEHEVSIISGLQVLENIDRKRFTPYAILLNEKGFFQYFEGFDNRHSFLKIKPRNILWGKDEKGPFFHTLEILKKKVYVDAAYLAFHGGNGESGQMQGYLEILDIPYTSPNVEASSVSMNKVITKEILEYNNIKTVPFTRVFSTEVLTDVDNSVRTVLSQLKLPVIIKPAHLGSSIGINLAHSPVELKKFLLEAAHLDSEILIEKLIKNFQEYNVSVRKISSNIETSEVERPISKGEILSFTDKYERGGKKTGGMASLCRELPAKIPNKMKKILQNLAVDIFQKIRAKGMVRIDFMVSGKAIYVTEVNPIPGSMGYYLWEASGIPFKEQITYMINQAISDHEESISKNINYKSNIVEKFVSSRGR